MVCGRCIKHPSADAGGEVCRQIFLRFIKTWCTSQIFLHSRMSVRNLFIFQLPATRTKTETWKCSNGLLQYTSLCRYVVCSVWKMLCSCVDIPSILSPLNNNTQYITVPPLRKGGHLYGKMQREITYFLASGKNYFYTISYLLMNQAHISKGGRVESFMASLQGVLEVCRTNLPPASANH